MSDSSGRPTPTSGAEMPPTFTWEHKTLDVNSQTALDEALDEFCNEGWELLQFSTYNEVDIKGYQGHVTSSNEPRYVAVLRHKVTLPTKPGPAKRPRKR